MQEFRTTCSLFISMYAEKHKRAIYACEVLGWEIKQTSPILTSNIDKSISATRK